MTLVSVEIKWWEYIYIYICRSLNVFLTEKLENDWTDSAIFFKYSLKSEKDFYGESKNGIIAEKIVKTELK